MGKTGKGTIIDRAKREVEGFSIMFAKLEQKVTLGGLSESTLINYGRAIARISIHFDMIAAVLEEELINGYLFDLVKGCLLQRAISNILSTVFGICSVCTIAKTRPSSCLA